MSLLCIPNARTALVVKSKSDLKKFWLLVYIQPRNDRTFISGTFYRKFSVDHWYIATKIGS